MRLTTKEAGDMISRVTPDKDGLYAKESFINILTVWKMNLKPPFLKFEFNLYINTTLIFSPTFFSHSQRSGLLSVVLSLTPSGIIYWKVVKVL